MKLNEKDIQDIKYNQGFSDALACTTSILEKLLKETEVIIKQKEYKSILPIITHSILSISELWNEINRRNLIYIEKLAKKHDIMYNSDTHYLEIDENDNSIKIKERKGS